MKKISIKINNLSILAELNDTKTADAIYEALPLTGSINVWGEELYFMIPIDVELENEAREEVEIGDLAYWPSGPAFCAFFGRTPVSTSDKPRAYSPVNVFGRIVGDTEPLKTVRDGESILVDKSD